MNISSHCVQCLDIARRKHYQANIYARIFWFEERDRLGSAGLAIIKMFWEKLVAVKCSLVGSMYMLLTRAKIHRVFGISNAFIEHLHAI